VDFTNIDLEQPTLEQPILTAGEVLRKGKKSVSFKTDPEILARLTLVSEMMLKGTPAYKIAETLKESLGTAKLDISRVKQLWREESKGKLAIQREAALAQYKLALVTAWDMVEKNPERADRYLALVLAAQKRIDQLTGTEAPKEIEVGGIVKVKNIEQVRLKRWQQIAGSLQEMNVVEEVGDDLYSATR
jgi:hypothetical protein